MANYRNITKEENKDQAPPVLILPKGATLDSVGGEEHLGVKYVQLRGGRIGEIDLFIREDVLRRVP